MDMALTLWHFQKKFSSTRDLGSVTTPLVPLESKILPGKDRGPTLNHTVSHFSEVRLLNGQENTTLVLRVEDGEGREERERVMGKRLKRRVLAGNVGKGEGGEEK